MSGRIKSRNAQALCTVGIASASYFVASLMYVVWYPSSHHLAPTVPSLALALACLCKALFMDISASKTEQHTLVALPAFFALLTFATDAFICRGISFLPEIERASHGLRVELRHVQGTYDHESQTLRRRCKFNQAIQSVPRRSLLFQNTAICYRFWPGNITMLVFPELESTLVTSKEELIAQRTIENGGHKYIFVDSTIDDPTLGEIPDSDGYLATLPGFYDEATGRMLALSVLRDVFDGLRHHYRLVARTPLLSVYERTEAPSMAVGGP